MTSRKPCVYPQDSRPDFDAYRLGKGRPPAPNGKTPGAVARPPTYKPNSSAVVRLSEPVRWKFTSRMTGSAPLRPIGQPIASVGAKPPSVSTSGPRIVTIFPKSGRTDQHHEAYKNTFGGKTPSKAESHELDSLIGRFGEKSQNLGSIRDGPEQLRQSFRDAKAAGHDSVIVVGHSIGKANGPRELKLPDGSTVKLEEVYEWAAAEHLECRVATCYGRDFGIDAPISLGRVARLLADLAQPTATKPSEAADETSKTSTNPGPVSDWDDWDDRFSLRRDELGYNDIILVGATRDGVGRLHIWESVRARPIWIVLSSWLLLVAGILANASVMRWMHRQELGSFGSLNEMECEAAERFRQSRKLARATAVASVLTLAVALMAAELARQDRSYNAATGWTAQRSTVNLLALVGVGLMSLSALAGRVDPSRACPSPERRGCRNLSNIPYLAEECRYARSGPCCRLGEPPPCHCLLVQRLWQAPGTGDCIALVVGSLKRGYLCVGRDMRHLPRFSRRILRLAGVLGCPGRSRRIEDQTPAATPSEGHYRLAQGHLVLCCLRDLDCCRTREFLDDDVYCSLCPGSDHPIRH